MNTGIAAGLITMVCWGIGDFFISYATKKLGTMKTLFWGNFLGLMPPFLLIFLFPGQIQASLFDVGVLIAAGSLMLIAVYHFYQGLEHGEVSVVMPVASSYSLVTVILAVIFLGEELSQIQILGIAIVIMGLVLVSTDLRKLKGLHQVIGVKEALVAMFLWGIYFTVIKPVADSLNIISLFVVSNVLINMWLVSYPLAKTRISLDDMKGRMGMLFIFVTILFSIAWYALNYGIKNGYVSLVAPVSSLSPAITVLLAMIFFKEKLVANQKFGILVILGGLLLLSL